MKQGSPCSVLPVPPPRDIGAPESEATSNLCASHLRAFGLLDRLPWQVRAVVLTTLLGPPTASLILLAVVYFEYWRDTPFNLGDLLAAFVLFAIPVGYVLGTVPALLAASLHCVLLTVQPGPLQRRPLIRACLAAACGGLASCVWFWELGIPWGIYALVGALVMAASSLGTPQRARRAAPQFAINARA